MNFNEKKTYLSSKLIILDGAMGTMIQDMGLTEKDYVGELNIEAAVGNHDILSLSNPTAIEEIHNAFLESGADIISTNTFNATPISQEDYNLGHLVYEMNVEAAKLAKKCADKYSTPEKIRFVAGSIGPTNKSLSLSPNVEEPALRAVTFNEVKDSYKEQIKGLIDGGVDLLLYETIFDTLNARAALIAATEVYEEKNVELPIMISGTLTDKSGRTLSGQTLDAFIASMENEYVISYGLNCSFGAKQLIPYVKSLSNITDKLVSVHPNAGLPNELGEYDEIPETTKKFLQELTKDGYVNIIGGCCGTTPAHIKAITTLTSDATIHEPTKLDDVTEVAGLELLKITKENNFINVAERTNVAGSRKFARLVREKKYDEALEIARNQVENGGTIIDINFDDGLLDAKAEMIHFLRLIGSEPDISRVPIMIDSSEFEVIEAGLQSVQGKLIVNSISLKNGETDFIEKAKIIHKYNAAVVVMAFDEQGQAETYERKIEIAERAYKIMTEIVGFNPTNIIFDLNILAVATGIKEHNNYAVDFIEGVRWVKQNLPHAKTSGGLSNVSFSFRGNNKVREAMHSVFLYHAIDAGLDMAILNPGMIQIYDEIESTLLKKTEAVIMNTTEDATDELIEFAESLSKDKKEEAVIKEVSKEGYKDRLIGNIVKGTPSFLIENIDFALEDNVEPINIIENILMEGMGTVGELFGSGKMFLPQVVKSARVMKQAVEFLMPYIEETKTNSSSNGKILMATVKGDVHDIGKNIVKIVLECNNFEVIDAGIMVDPEIIIETALKEKVDMIGLSGLITPSLKEMIIVSEMLEEAELKIPILIGGATTSKLHTALKIAPVTKQPVIHCNDATTAVEAAVALMNDDLKNDFIMKTYDMYDKLRISNENKNIKYVSLDEARSKATSVTTPSAVPNYLGVKTVEVSISDLKPYIDWTYFFTAWEFKKVFPDILTDKRYKEEATKLYNDALEMLTKLDSSSLKIKGVIGLFKTTKDNEDIIVKHEDALYKFVNFRQQREGSEYLSLSDYLCEEDYIGGYACTAGINIDQAVVECDAVNDDYKEILIKTLVDRLAESFSEYLHRLVRIDLWGYSSDENIQISELHREKYVGTRPAFGYPSLPNHKEKETLFKLLNVTENTSISLTESHMMNPSGSVCGLYFAADTKYFDVYKISKDQIEDVASRLETEISEVEDLISDRLNYK